MEKLETMAYKMEPAGHEEPSPRRKYPTPDRRLAEAFENWLNISIDTWGRDNLQFFARYVIRDLDVIAEEAHALLLSNQNHQNIKHAAFFLSAAYNKQPQKNITFDINFPLENFGCGLKKEKVLVVLTDTMGSLGENSQGTILNYGTTRWQTGMSNQGLLVNYGEALSDFGQKTAGVTINLSKIDNYPVTDCQGYVINYGKIPEQRQKFVDYILRDKSRNAWKQFEIRNCIIDHMMAHEQKKIPELWEYLIELRTKFEPGKQDYNKALAALETLGQEPAKTIKTKIDDIFRRHGYDVA